MWLYNHPFAYADDSLKARRLRDLRDFIKVPSQYNKLELSPQWNYFLDRYDSSRQQNPRASRDHAITLDSPPNQYLPALKREVSAIKTVAPTRYYHISTGVLKRVFWSGMFHTNGPKSKLVWWFLDSCPVISDWLWDGTASAALQCLFRLGLGFEKGNMAFLSSRILLQRALQGISDSKACYIFQALKYTIWQFSEPFIPKDSSFVQSLQSCIIRIFLTMKYTIRVMIKVEHDRFRTWIMLPYWSGGAAYVHGIMGGEYMDRADEKD